MQTAQGDLVFVGLNTSSPKVFLGGVLVSGVCDIRADWDDDSPRVKLKVVAGANDASMLDALRTAGVIVKEV